MYKKKCKTAGLEEILFSFRDFEIDCARTFDIVSVLIEHSDSTYNGKNTESEREREEKSTRKKTQRLRRHIRYVNPGRTKLKR